VSDNPLIEAKRKEIAAFDAQIEAITQKKEIAKAMLEGMMLMVNQSDPSIGASPNSKSTDSRRMRLGAKKRVIYSLVINGFETVKALTSTLKESNIDRRYIRDVVRRAISSGDMLGEVDDKFILSESGKALFNGAAKPKDWQQYEVYASKMPYRPHVPRQMPGGGLLGQTQSLATIVEAQAAAREAESALAAARATHIHDLAANVAAVPVDIYYGGGEIADPTKPET